jgi:hypothetical protein
MVRSRTLALVAALAFSLAFPVSAALAQQQQQQQPQPGGAFGPLPPAAPEPTPEPTPIEVPGAVDDEGDVGRPVLFAVGGGLVLLFAAIGIFITRDARRSLPHRGRELATGPRDEGPHRKAREAKSKARAKARAARCSRKRNRRVAR